MTIGSKPYAVGHCEFGSNKSRDLMVLMLELILKLVSCVF
jgi:hypothetical protein